MAVRVVRRWLSLACLVGGSFLTREAAAQSGALYLLMPFGARAVGQGEAVAADTTLGSEGMWWNPAALARMSKNELANHYSQTYIATSNMVSFVRPSRVLGTLAASAYFVNYGDQQATDINGNSTGTISNNNYQFALAYATPMGKRLSAGLTYKLAMLRFNQCRGVCNNQDPISGSTSALDLGAQYALPTTIPVSVGISVRNLGPALQARDAEQADPLPRVIQVGLRTQVPSKALTERKIVLELSADFVSAQALDGAAGGVGATMTYDKQLFIRGGYKQQPGQTKGPSLGFGYERPAFSIDIAQKFDGLASEGGKPATYFTLRARF